MSARVRSAVCAHLHRRAPQQALHSLRLRATTLAAAQGLSMSHKDGTQSYHTEFSEN